MRYLSAFILIALLGCETPVDSLEAEEPTATKAEVTDPPGSQILTLSYGEEDWQASGKFAFISFDVPEITNAVIDAGGVLALWSLDRKQWHSLPFTYLFNSDEWTIFEYSYSISRFELRQQSQGEGMVFEGGHVRIFVFD